jgi:hypothetical protein
VALAPTPKFGITPCHPNNDQLDAVLDELAIELSKGKSVKGTLAALDPELERLYPTIISLYKALCVNAGSAPAHWRHALKNEWVEFSAPW